MALFQRRPDAGYTTRYYTIGQNKQVLIVGLGNPGPEYELTRHNVGFAALDAFAAASGFDPWMNKKDLKCETTTARLGDTQTILVKPSTYMNNSGEAAQAVAHFYKVPVERILVVYDDIDVPFGQIRLRTGGSSGGHNGIKSLIQYIGEGFGRVRIGIGPKTPEQMDRADFVLAKFSSEQQKQLKNLTRETTAILSEYCFSGGQLPTETRSFIV